MRRRRGADSARAGRDSVWLSRLSEMNWNRFERSTPAQCAQFCTRWSTHRHTIHGQTSTAKQLIIAVKWKILRARKSNIFVNRGLGSDCRTQRQLAPNWNLKNQKINKHADTPPTSTTNEPKTSQSMTLEQLAAPKRAHALLRCFSQKPARTLPTRNQIKERANCRIDDMCVWWLFLACGLLCGVTFGHLLAKRALAFAIYARRKSHGEESSGSSRSLKSGEL